MHKLFLLICLLSVGCVSSGKYDELKKSCEEKEEKLKQELKDSDEKYASLLKEKAALRSSVDEMKDALEELRKRREETEERIKEFRSLLDKFKSLIDSGKLKVRIVDGRMVVVLSSDVLFASGSKELSSGGKAAIKEVSLVLATIKDRKFQVEGHTDTDKTRSSVYTNWELAADRALTVLHTMVGAGMPETKISAASFGESRPVAPNDTSKNKAQNRRIEIVVVPDLSQLPGYEELKKMTEAE